MLRLTRISSIRNALLVGMLALSTFSLVMTPSAEASSIRRSDLQITASFSEPRVRPNAQTLIIITAQNNGPEFSGGTINFNVSRKFYPVALNGNGMQCSHKEGHFFDVPVWDVTCTKSKIDAPSLGGERIIFTTMAPEKPGTYELMAGITPHYTRDINEDNNRAGAKITVAP